MTRSELEKLLKEIESELNGDAEHDADVLNEWGDRYRGKPGAEPLMRAISNRLFDMMMEEDGDLTQEIFEDMVNSADEDYQEALKLIDQGQLEEALTKLQVLTEVVAAYPLSDDAVWTDFTSYLEALIFQDYFQAHIRGREVLRHPMQPGPILFTCGNLAIEMGNVEEALKPLQLLYKLNPVCPKYIFELGEVYKRTGHLNDAYDNALWGLSCAANREELARCYRDLAYCLTETGAYEDAVMLYLLSLRFQTTRQAEVEIAWIRKKTGVKAENYTEDMILKRCDELHIPVGLSETVLMNIYFMNSLTQEDEPDDEED